MPNWSETTRNILTGVPAGASAPGLQQVGVPTAQDGVESVLWEFYETINYPLNTLASFAQNSQLFKQPIGSGLARNLQLPTTLDRAFVNFVVQCTVDILPNPGSTLDPTLIDGQILQRAANYLLMATNLNVSVSSKQYLQASLVNWANVTYPAILDGVLGQVAPAPFAMFPSSFNEQQKNCLILDPEIEWPANGNVDITLNTNVAQFAKDAFGLAPGSLTTPLWLQGLDVTFRFSFWGDLGRIVK